VDQEHAPAPGVPGSVDLGVEGARRGVGRRYVAGEVIGVAAAVGAMIALLTPRLMRKRSAAGAA
jgi:hypothetical protein